MEGGYCLADNQTSALLQAFDQSLTIKDANAFFAQLDKEGFTDSKIQMSDTTPVDTLRQQVWYWAAEYYYDQQNYDMAQEMGLKALPLCQEGGNRSVEGDCLNLLSLIFIRQGNFNEAVRYAKLCNELDMKTGHKDNIASSLNTLAGIYMSMRQPKEAEKYVLKGLQYAKEAGNPQRQAVLLGMASEVYHHLEEEDKALDYATQAWQLEKQLGRQDKIAVRQAQRAAALIALKRFDDAKQALQEAIPGLRQSGNRHSLGIACNQMGQLLHNENNDSAAVRYFNEALAIFTDQHDIFNESYSRKGLYMALRATDPALAMEHNDRYNELRDSLYDEKTGELLSKYATEYGYGELQAENAAMQHTQRIYYIIGIAGILLLLALLTFGVWRSRRDRQRIQELIRDISELQKHLAEDVDSKKETASDETQETTETNEADRQFLFRLIEVVNAGLPTGHYGVEDVASEMNMSVQTFRRRLMTVTGESPKAFISAIQMELAAKLLTNSPDMPISQVANRCGYDEATSFNRIFRKAYGMTPTQYREKQ
ncbi:MAG: helix-turn-helix domain-containing protein [Prevotella sp.]|nr:helix-turn-helix domain-containing protein [Prevotella sp.]